MGVKEGVSRQIERLGRRTSAFLEEKKLYGRIRSLEKEIHDLYAAIGMSVFSMWKREHADVDASRLVKHIEAIQRKLDEIQEKKEKISQIREQAACPDRGEEARTGGGEAPLKSPALLESFERAQENGQTPVRMGQSSGKDEVFFEEEGQEGGTSGPSASRDGIRCAGCGALCPSGAHYCRKCGRRLDETETL